MTPTTVALTVALALLSQGPARDGGLSGGKKLLAPKLDLGPQHFDKLPTGEGLKRVEQVPDQDRPSPSSATRPEYSVLRVIHGRGFIKTSEGSKPSTPYPAVLASGEPPTMEKFSTVVRVKSRAKRNTSVELVILDQRADTVMNAEGQLFFRGGDETEWQVDWEPTGIRRTGEFQVLVRVGGQPMGTFPFKVELKDKPKDAPAAKDAASDAGAPK